MKLTVIVSSAQAQGLTVWGGAGGCKKMCVYIYIYILYYTFNEEPFGAEFLFPPGSRESLGAVGKLKTPSSGPAPLA